MAALTAFNLKKIGISGGESEKKRRLTGKRAASTALNRKKSIVNGAEQEKWRL